MLRLTNEHVFGRFMISSGITMAIVSGFVFFAMRPVETLLGEKLGPYILLGVIGVSVIAVGILNDKCPPRITVPLGLAGWFITALFLLVFV
jgi:hypothetical protein